MQFLAYSDRSMGDRCIVLPAEVILTCVNRYPEKFTPNVNCQIWQAAIS